MRVSTSEQAQSGLGLAAQRAAIESEATRKGWVLVAILEDAGISGKSVKDRKALEAAIAMLEAGAAEALVVSKLDRLSRSTVDFGLLLRRATANGWALAVIDMDLDTTKANGKLVANILISLAEWERDTTVQRTKDALAALKATGVQLGRPRTLPDRVVDRIRRQREAGESLGAIAKALNADAIPTAHGGEQWHASTVRAVLNRS